MICVLTDEKKKKREEKKDKKTLSSSVVYIRLHGGTSLVTKLSYTISSLFPHYYCVAKYMKWNGYRYEVTEEHDSLTAIQ
jgi:hypothetical protein